MLRTTENPGAPAETRERTRQEQARDNLLAAAELVEQGWTRGGLFSWNEKRGDYDLCALGALGLASGLLRRNPRTGGMEWATAADPHLAPGAQVPGVEELARALPYYPETVRSEREPRHRVTNWNDYFAGGGAEVAALMRKVARELAT